MTPNDYDFFCPLRRSAITVIVSRFDLYPGTMVFFIQVSTIFLLALVDNFKDKYRTVCFKTTADIKCLKYFLLKWLLKIYDRTTELFFMQTYHRLS